MVIQYKIETNRRKKNKKNNGFRRLVRRGCHHQSDCEVSRLSELNNAPLCSFLKLLVWRGWSFSFLVVTQPSTSHHNVRQTITLRLQCGVEVSKKKGRK